MKFPLLSKVGSIGAVVLGLLWALGTVQSLVAERQSRQEEAQTNVANSLAGSQTLLGPVLIRTCTETWIAGYSEAPERKPLLESYTHTLRLPPKLLSTQARVQMEPRYRGLFKVNSYVTHAQLNANWDDVSGLIPKPRHEASRMACQPAQVSLAVSDARGIQIADLRLNQQLMPVLPGSGMADPSVGFHVNLNEALLTAGQAVNAMVNVELAGTQSLSVVPVGDTTLVKLSANWPHPAFGGRFLPSERQVNEHGFNATWKVSALASTAQQHWRNGADLCPTLSSSDPSMVVPATEGQTSRREPCVESFGVDFMDPVNPYVLNDRATKYGLLFIVLTFVGVGLIEALRQLRVHPIQYLLVGAALAVFFLLLLSLSEHMAFALAYLGSSVACTLLLLFYGIYVLQGWWAGAGFGLVIATLFGTLYVLLQMEQTALMLGSVLIFLVLMVIMVSTRKLNWYALVANLREQSDVVLVSEPSK